MVTINTTLTDYEKIRLILNNENVNHFTVNIDKKDGTNLKTLRTIKTFYKFRNDELVEVINKEALRSHY